MVSSFGNSDWLWNEAEQLVNISFNRIIYEVNNRRESVLTSLRDIRDIIPTLMRSIQQLEEEIDRIENEMTENFLHSRKTSMISDIKNQISEIQMQASCAEFDYQFVFDDTELRTALSTIGVFKKSPKHYLSKTCMNGCFKIPIESEKIGKFSVDEETQIIAINNPHDKEIRYFDIWGLSKLNCISLEWYPTICEIELINCEEILVSILESKSILKIQFDPRREQVETKVVSETSNKFEGIISLSYDKKYDQIYALSSTQNFVYKLERNLILLDIVKISCTSPQSLFVGEDLIYILESTTSYPCLHVLSKSSNRMGKIIQCERCDSDFDQATSFCVDRNENIILTLKNLIEIYSPSGHLLHSLALNQDPDTIIQPISVFVTLNYDIIVLSNSSKYPIQVF